MQPYDGTRRRIRWTFACMAATLFASSALATAAASASEPADDHAGGATPLKLRVALVAAVDQPGDRDWYAVALTDDDDDFVTVRRTAGACAAQALRVTVLNPEAHAIRWKTVLPNTAASLELPKGKPGRYLVEIDAQGEPGCGELGYELVRGAKESTGSGTGSDAECRAAKGQLADDRRARARFSPYLKSRDPKTVKRYRGLLRRVDAALREDRRDVGTYCGKRK